MSGAGRPVAGLTAHRLRHRLARTQVEGRVPTLVARVVRDGETVWAGHVGAEPAAGHDPQDVQFRIGSITKTLTAVLVLQLADEGRIDLDRPAADVLGDIGYADRSLRALLAHAAGIPSEPAGEWWERSAGAGFDELVAANDGSGTVFGTHERFHYSNLGYALLGELVARVHGRPWRDCVRDLVLGPLGMTRTTYSPEGARAQGHSVHPYEGTLVDEPATDTGAMAPAGQLWSTAEDLARYAAFLVDGHPDVLPRRTLVGASHPLAGAVESGLAAAHGLGFQLHAGGSGVLVGHTGSMPGFLAACLVDRPRRSGAVVLADATTGFAPSVLAAGLLDDLEECEPAVPEPWRPTARVPAALQGVPGVWHWGNTALVFRLEGEELVVRDGGTEQYRFAVRDGRLVGTSGYHAGEELHVVRRPDGSVSHLVAATFVYTRTPYDPEVPVPGGHPSR